MLKATAAAAADGALKKKNGDEDDEDAEASEPEDDDDEPPKKRPMKGSSSESRVRGLRKAPAAKDGAPMMKARPAAFVAGGAPGASRRPTEYGGGKIYYSDRKKSFRVYRRRGDKVDTTVSVDWSSPADVRRAWKQALHKIDSDTRPQ